MYTKVIARQTSDIFGDDDRDDFVPFCNRQNDIINFASLMTFYSARNARIASAVLATAIPSVCLSVCPSVCPSHAGIVSKRRQVARRSLHRWIAKCV